MAEPTDIEWQIFNAREAQNWVHGWPTAVVSLVDPDDEHLLATSPRPDLLQLRLFLADVTDPGHPNAATEADIDRLVAFARRLPDGTRLLAHCRGGIGRSPAAVITLLVAAGWDPAVAFDRVTSQRQIARPNGWLLLLADQQLTPHRTDGIFPAYVRWAQQQPWWHPVPQRITRDATKGRLSFDRCVDLVKAQTHKQREVDRGPFRS